MSLVLARESRRVTERRSPNGISRWQPIVALLRLPKSRALLFPACSSKRSSSSAALAYLAASMLERFTFLGPGQVGLMLAGYGVGGLVYSGPVKRLVPRIGERGVLLLGGSLLCAGYLLMRGMPAGGCSSRR